MEPQPFLSLKFLATRAVAVDYFHRYHAVKRAATAYRLKPQDYFMRLIQVPLILHESIAIALKGVQKELNRWHRKHAQLFAHSNKRFASRKQHLDLFFDLIKWEQHDLLVDDYNTTLAIVEENRNWPQLVFQFACAYALECELVQIDYVAIRAFKHRLGDHPLFEFWFEYYNRGDKIFDQEGLAPRGIVTNAFQWAVRYGYLSYVQFVWSKVDPSQAEFLGLLHWRSICNRAQDADLFMFVGSQLFSLNPTAFGRITAQLFCTHVKIAVDATTKETEQNGKLAAMPKRKNEGWPVVEFFLTHCGFRTLSNIIAYDGYEALVVCILNRDLQKFRTLLKYLTPDARKGLPRVINQRVKQEPVKDFLLRCLDEEE